MKVSVLINNYNNGPWIGACVDSALKQTRPADEVIVYDDGSTDQSLDVLRAYGDRIRLIEGRHDDRLTGRRSQVLAVGRALEASTGDHLYLLDGDDVFLPEKIEVYERRWAAYPEAILVQAQTFMVDENGVRGRDNHWAYKHAVNYLERVYELHDCDLFYSTSALAFRRDYLLARYPLNTYGHNLAVDEALAAVFPLYGEGVFVTGAYTGWRQRTRSLSRENRRDHLEEMWIRNRYFNAYAHALGARPLVPWFNRLLVRQTVRKLMSDRLVGWYLKRREARAEAVAGGAT